MSPWRKDGRKQVHFTVGTGQQLFFRFFFYCCRLDRLALAIVAVIVVTVLSLPCGLGCGCFLDPAFLFFFLPEILLQIRELLGHINYLNISELISEGGVVNYVLPTN